MSVESPQPAVIRSEANVCRTETQTNETYIMRVMRDLREFYKSGIENIEIVPEEDNISVVHALIHGPDSTPYANGFFYFMVRFPNTYPICAPTVKLMTTDSFKVRFNPNLYQNGRVCLSILGTWTGPAWSPANTLLTVLLSIQSLMNEKPYHNEPGFESTKLSNCPDVQKRVDCYNEIITHETIRVAVIGMLEESSSDARNMPQILRDVMISSFKNNYKHFEDIVKSKLELTGRPMKDPFGANRGTYDYKTLLNKLQEMKTKYNISDKDSESCAAFKEAKVEPYSQIASKYMVNEEKQQNKVDEKDDWEAIIDDMNMESMDEDFEDIQYSEDSDSEDKHEDQKQIN